MGQFSWFTCDTDDQIVDNRVENVYVLIPEKFGGGHILETCYDGYGNFGGHDIYDLVADWNKECLMDVYAIGNDCKNLTSMQQVVKVFVEEGDEAASKLAKELFDEDGSRWLISDWKRNIGIKIACYDEDNAKLPYPIKIAKLETSVYEDYPFSLSDPNQGWEEDDFEEDEYDDEYYEDDYYDEEYEEE